jgi:acetylornithine deacetylase
MSLSTRELLAKLVAFDTTSRNSNLDCIAWIADYLAGFGIESRLSYDQDKRKANLFARIGPLDQPALVLSGHSDVVPVDGQAWNTDPFSLVEQDGKLYARGSSDMKGFIACALALVPKAVSLAKAGKLKRPLGLAFSYDEEVGCLGVRPLIEDLLAAGIPVGGCIIGEPTEMKPVIAHKGIAHYRCRVIGREAHSSLTPYGVNAIEYAARLISHLRLLADTEAQFGHRSQLYDVPFTTLQTGLIKGGVAANIVPRDCEFVFECRWLPGDDPERFLQSLFDYVEGQRAEMRQVAPEADIIVEPIVHCPAFEAERESETMRLVEHLCGHCDSSAVAYSTEAGLFQLAGFPAVVCGPGSIKQAHKPNEFIEIAQLAACDDWLGRLLQTLL